MNSQQRVHFKAPRFMRARDECRHLNKRLVNTLGEMLVMAGIVELLLEMCASINFERIQRDPRSKDVEIVDKIFGFMCAIVSLLSGTLAMLSSRSLQIRHAVMTFIVCIGCGMFSIGILVRTAISLNLIAEYHTDELVFYEIIDSLVLTMTIFGVIASFILCFHIGQCFKKQRQQTPRECLVFYEPCTTESALWFVPNTDLNFTGSQLPGANGAGMKINSKKVANGQLLMSAIPGVSLNQVDFVRALTPSGSPVLARLRPRGTPIGTPLSGCSPMTSRMGSPSSYRRNRNVSECSEADSEITNQNESIPRSSTITSQDRISEKSDSGLGIDDTGKKVANEMSVSIPVTCAVDLHTYNSSGKDSPVECAKSPCRVTIVSDEGIHSSCDKIEPNTPESSTKPDEFLNWSLSKRRRHRTVDSGIESEPDRAELRRRLLSSDTDGGFDNDTEKISEVDTLLSREDVFDPDEVEILDDGSLSEASKIEGRQRKRHPAGFIPQIVE